MNNFTTITIKDLKHSYNVVERAVKLKMAQEDREKINDCNLIISPPELSKYGTFDKKYLNDIFKIGYDATYQALINNQSFLTATTKN